VLLGRAETRLTSSLTGLLIAAVPLIGALIVTVGGGEHVDRRRWLGLLVGLVGVAAIVGLDVGQANVGALLEVGGVAVCYAVGPIIFARWLTDVPALGVVTASLLLTAVVYLPFAATHWTSSPSSHVILSVIGLAVICTAIAFLVFFALINEVGPVRATVITYVNPAVAAVLGVTILNEHLTFGMIAGFALVLAGSVLATGGTVEPVPEP
jgi:drug/metabolite transporter (DMT)-like permease